MDIPRIFNITESAHRIHNPFTPEKLATLGAALRLETGTRVLDLGSGSGEIANRSPFRRLTSFGIGLAISPEPLPRSSTRVPVSRRSAAPRVASFSGVNGLWMR